LGKNALRVHWICALYETSLGNIYLCLVSTIVSHAQEQTATWVERLVLDWSKELTCMVESLKGLKLVVLGTLRTGGVHDHWAILGDQAYD